MIRTSGALAAVALTILGNAALAQTDSAQGCDTLQGRTIAKSEIGLPSGDATVTSAAMTTMPATMGATEPTIVYCTLLGSIAPLDPAAPPINFQINLPAQWNGRAVQYGG